MVPICIGNHCIKGCENVNYEAVRDFLFLLRLWSGGCNKCAQPALLGTAELQSSSRKVKHLHVSVGLGLLVSLVNLRERVDWSDSLFHFPILFSEFIRGNIWVFLIIGGLASWTRWSPFSIDFVAIIITVHLCRECKISPFSFASLLQPCLLSIEQTNFMLRC